MIFAGVFIATSVVRSISATGGNDPADKWGCAGARPVVSPTPVHRGQTITVASGSAHCTRALPDDASFEITLSADGSPTSSVQSQASVHHDGSFTITLTVPDDFPLGVAQVRVGDGDYVPCHDTGAAPADGMRLVSCAASMSPVEVVG
ncbi:hypothetical protein [Gryllotalpicola koreensis]|uniref:Secreted protein n=1 Tax=Gryllotalpicola koreensis TaxID=993086 RepID=A0ABP8A093_9MICO